MFLFDQLRDITKRGWSGRLIFCFLKWRDRLAGALKEMQSEGKADRVFHLISASNGSIHREKNDQPLIKVMLPPSFCGTEKVH